MFFKVAQKSLILIKKLAQKVFKIALSGHTAL